MNTDIFQDKQEVLDDGNIKLIRLYKKSIPMTYSMVIESWLESVEFLDFYNSIFKNCGYKSYVWETPFISRRNMDQIFEFVILRTPTYFSSPDYKTFESYFNVDKQNMGIVSFPNLGHDAILVVPSPIYKNVNYSSLASFLQEAPVNQQRALWKLTALEIKKQISSLPLWVSVAGGGVAWLHVRLDSQPKYYRYSAYKSV